MTRPPRTITEIPPVVRAAAEFFALGDVAQAEPIDAGVANRNFLVDTGRGRFVVKEVRERDADAVSSELAHVDRVVAHGIPAPTFLAGADGARVLRFEAHCVLALVRVPGRHPLPSAPECNEVGATLARLHAVPLEGLPARRNWLSDGALVRQVDALRDRAGPAGRSLRESVERLDSSGLRGLPRSIVHGDMHSYNLIFDGHRLVALLDWEEVGVGASILDLASAILWMCLDDDGRVLPERFDSLVSAYGCVRPLQAAEWSMLGTAVRLVAHTVSAWLLHRFAVVEPDAHRLAAISGFWGFDVDTLVLPRGPVADAP